VRALASVVCDVFADPDRDTTYRGTIEAAARRVIPGNWLLVTAAKLA
jgi:hypothetical protein